MKNCCDFGGPEPRGFVVRCKRGLDERLRSRLSAKVLVLTSSLDGARIHDHRVKDLPEPPAASRRQIHGNHVAPWDSGIKQSWCQDVRRLYAISISDAVVSGEGAGIAGIDIVSEVAVRASTRS